MVWCKRVGNLGKKPWPLLFDLWLFDMQADFLMESPEIMWCNMFEQQSKSALFFRLTGSTSPGCGGSFKDRKPFGSVGLLSGTARQNKPLTERQVVGVPASGVHAVLTGCTTAGLTTARLTDSTDRMLQCRQRSPDADLLAADSTANSAICPALGLSVLFIYSIYPCLCPSLPIFAHLCTYLSIYRI